MLSVNEVPKKDRWRLSTFEVMKYDPKYRNAKGHYLKKEWTEFEIGKSFNGKLLTYEVYKKTEDKYISAIKYFFEYYNCNRIQFVEAQFLYEEDELNFLLDKELEHFYVALKRRRILSIEETEMAARLILRNAMFGRFYCKGKKEISIRFGYDFYMYFNATGNEGKIKDYIEKKIGLFTHR